ncbi:MAG: hypothetical protein Q8R76_08840 [Candidatus Omnitrophota bacterium]|nr:hypothetical protein [Candidatus Omnitrophota bacterium]
MKDNLLHGSCVFSATAALVLLVIPFAVLAESGISELDHTFQEEQLLASNTIAAPLVTAGRMAEPAIAIEGMSLLAKPLTTGHQGALDYQGIAEHGVRIQFRQIKEPVAFFWVFDEPVDLSDRWVRVYYAGPIVPNRLQLKLDHAEVRLDGAFDIYLENSTWTQTVFFKLPRKKTFEAIDSLRLVANPGLLKNSSADFWILEVEVLPEGNDPLGGVSDLSRFEWYDRPFRPDNHIGINSTHYKAT